MSQGGWPFSDGDGLKWYQLSLILPLKIESSGQHEFCNLVELILWIYQRSFNQVMELIHSLLWERGSKRFAFVMGNKTGNCPSIDKEYFHIKEWKNFIQTYIFAKHKISSILQSYNNAIFLPKVPHSSGKTKKHQFKFIHMIFVTFIWRFVYFSRCLCSHYVPVFKFRCT